MRHAAPQQPFQLIADADADAVEPDMHLTVAHIARRPFGDRRAGGLRQRRQPPQLALAFKHPRAVHLQQNPMQTHHVVAAGFFPEIVKKQLRQPAQHLGELRQPLADLHHLLRQFAHREAVLRFLAGRHVEIEDIIQRGNQLIQLLAVAGQRSGLASGGVVFGRNCSMQVATSLQNRSSCRRNQGR
jgi:hypothetical protein